MAVSRDQNFNTAMTSTQTSPFDITGSVASNSNRVLLAAADFFSDNVTGVTMTWDFGATAQAMALIRKGVTGGVLRSVYLFGLIAPTVGNGLTLRTTWATGGTQTGGAGGLSLFSADQVTGWTNDRQDSGTSTTAPSTVDTSSGDLEVLAHANDNSLGLSLTSGTSEWINTATDGNYAMASRAADGGSVSWNLTTSVAWVTVMTRVLAAGAAPDVGGPQQTLFRVRLRTY